jgi:hypothetical protein
MRQAIEALSLVVRRLSSSGRYGSGDYPWRPSSDRRQILFVSTCPHTANWATNHQIPPNFDFWTWWARHGWEVTGAGAAFITGNNGTNTGRGVGRGRQNFVAAATKFAANCDHFRGDVPEIHRN